MLTNVSKKPDVFAAISHASRRRMLDLLSTSERSVGVLASHFSMRRPAVSQHLRILLDAGLVAERRNGRERLYRLVPDQLAPVRNWLAAYERFWDDRLARLEMHLSKGTSE